MKPPALHAFEFMDLDALPRSLRHTLRDILECGNSRPFRGYYDGVARVVLEAAEEVSTIVELGAGTAPITARLAERVGDVRLVAVDREPDRARLASLRRRFPCIEPCDDAVDIEGPPLPAHSVVVISASLHHVRRTRRRAALQALRERADVVVVAEPLRRTWISVLFVLLSIVPALLTPLRFAAREGRWRRVVWCWLLPVAPVLFVWDGLISCLRQWTLQEWAATAPSSLLLTPVSIVATYHR